MAEDQNMALELARVLVRQRLGEDGALSMEILEEAADQVMDLMSARGIDVDRQSLVRQLEEVFIVHMLRPVVLEDRDENHRPWLLSRRSEIQWRYSDRYSRLLQSKNWPEAALTGIDNLSDLILDKLGDPDRDGAWDRRGLVVGHVQSGKTANYIGLVNKAADAGYRIIIVLAGVHNSLRSQTQLRFDEGFLGFDSRPNPDDRNRRRPIGVGIHGATLTVNTVTNSGENGDFSRPVADHLGVDPEQNPWLFVIKKNGHVMRNLVQWLDRISDVETEDGERRISRFPLLLIDDECDYGSVDTARDSIGTDGNPNMDHEPRALNRLTRQILQKFHRSSYVGYTATPFANIFIHEAGETESEGEDLFPRSFIVSLPPPSDYVGPRRMLGLDPERDPEGQGKEGLPLFRFVDDHARTLAENEQEGWMPPRHRRNHLPVVDGPDRVPPSLRRAIFSFVLACAIRRHRGQTQVHNSMLVHVTRYVDVQAMVQQQVQLELREMQNRLRRGDGGRQPTILEELHDIWIDDFIPTIEAVSLKSVPETGWSDIVTHIVPAALAITVRAINGSAGDVLDYVEHQETGLSVIAIGGDKLSRGLTLEGLTVSYFLRASKMYDTLMQMGRWFGYRPGYLDLCRIYMPERLFEWFYRITQANEELREEFDAMEQSNATPRDFGLRVRSHPGLLVTSRVKMRHTRQVELRYSGDIPETIKFSKKVEWLEHNYGATQRFLTRLAADTTVQHEVHPERIRDGSAARWTGGHCWINVKPDHVVSFLEDYRTHEDVYRVRNELLRDYILLENAEGNLTRWTVLLVSGRGERDEDLIEGGIDMVKRSQYPEQAVGDAYTIRRLVSPRDETIDLSPEQYAEALRRTREMAGLEERGSPVGPKIREVRPSQQGVLILYPLDPAGVTDAGSDGASVVGFAMSFPAIDGHRTVRYTVNNTYWEQEIGAAH